MKRATAVIGLVVLLQFPSLALAESPLQVECSMEQSRPGRVLVCEYWMLGRLDGELADLHERNVLAGRAGSVELKRWVGERDACSDVECLDRLYEAGIREARLALVDVEDRQPVPVLTNARGVPLRIVKQRGAAAPALPEVTQEPAVRERPALETAASLVMILFLVAALGYALFARRLAA